MQGEDVTAEIVVDDGAAGSRGRLTVLTLVWRPSDPLAVTMSLVSSPDHPALPRGRWVVLRDFLRYGLDEPTGDGDVRITPEVAAADGAPDPGGSANGASPNRASPNRASPSGASPNGASPNGAAGGHGDGSADADAGGEGLRRVWLELCRGDRQSDVRVGADELREFLDRTEQVLPTGEERPEKELDQVIEALLRT